MYHSNTFNLRQYLNQLQTAAEALRQNLNVYSNSMKSLIIPSEVQEKMKQGILENNIKHAESIKIIKRILAPNQIDMSTILNFQEIKDLSKVEQNYKELISFRKKLESAIAVQTIKNNKTSFSVNTIQESAILRETNTIVKEPTQKILLINLNKNKEKGDYLLNVDDSLKDKEITRPNRQNYYNDGFTHIVIVAKLNKKSQEKHGVTHLTEFFKLFKHYHSKIPLTNIQIKEFSKFWDGSLKKAVSSNKCWHEPYPNGFAVQTEVKDFGIKNFILKDIEKLAIERTFKLLNENEKPQFFKNYKNNEEKQNIIEKKEEKSVINDLNNPDQSSKCALIFFEKDHKHHDFYFNAIDYDYELDADVPFKGIRINSDGFYEQENFDFLFLVIRFDPNSENKYQCKYLTECMRFNKEDNRFKKLELTIDQVVTISNQCWDKFINLHVENNGKLKSIMYNTLCGTQTLVTDENIANMLAKEATIALENHNNKEMDDDIIDDPFDDMNDSDKDDHFNEMDEEKNIIETALDATDGLNINENDAMDHQRFFNKSEKQDQLHANNDPIKIKTVEDFKNKIYELITSINNQNSNQTLDELMSNVKSHMSGSIYTKFNSLVEDGEYDKPLLIEDLIDENDSNIIEDLESAFINLTY